MRFSKKKVLLACARALPALAAVLPSESSQPDVARPKGKQLLELDFQEDYAEATFSVPCAGCLGTSHDDESIILSVKTHTNDQPCGVSNITLNGAYLPQEWNGDVASGSGSFSGITDIQESAWFLQHDLDLQWESACLHGEQEEDDVAQVLTVNIKSIDGKKLATSPGFTLSFKQVSPPELLRLQSTPDRLASSSAHAESWRNPPAHLRLVIPNKVLSSETIETSGQSQLEDDIRELKALQAEVQKLQKIIAEKKKHIDAQVKHEANNFKEELRKCENITCVFKTIGNGAHGAWRLLYIHFRPNHHHHHPPPPPPPPMGRPEDDAYHRAWREGNHKQGNIRIESDGPPPPPPPPPLPPHHGGHPPPPPPPPPPPHGRHGRIHMPPPESPFVIALEIVLGLLCCGYIFAVVHHRCSSLRTRTDRAAAQEERLNRTLYRRAARRHNWRKWWRGNWRDQTRIADYEEKRCLIADQEGVLEDAMQEEIRQLRAAHGVVNDLVIHAEEGRPITYPHNYCHCAHTSPQTPYSPLSTSSSYPPTSLPSRPPSRTDSLPGYRSSASSSPPAYEEDEDVSDAVANGFRRYSSTSSESSRWTPESSVVDVSPRPSAETLRFLGREGSLRGGLGGEMEEEEFAEMEGRGTGVGEKN